MKKYRSTYYFLIFSITFLLLTIIQVVPSRPMLLAERFIPGSGWIEVVLFSFFAVWMAEKLNTTSDYSTWRKRIWVAFSIFFFLQLLLGLLGVEECLMTGKLHFPIPGMILGDRFIGVNSPLWCFCLLEQSFYPVPPGVASCATLDPWIYYFRAIKTRGLMLKIC